MNFALEENLPSRDLKLNRKNGFTFTADIVEGGTSQDAHS